MSILNKLTLKNLFLFVCLSLISTTAMPAPWCDCHVTVRAVYINSEGNTAVGGGKVFVSRTQNEQNTANCTKAEVKRRLILGCSHNTDNFPCPVYLSAKPDDGFEFDYWECTLKEGTYYPSIYSGTAVNTKLYKALPAAQKACVSVRGNGYGSSSESTEATDTNAVWVAHFKRAEMQTVTVQSEQTNLGTANIDKVTNYVGDEVTITAWCGNSGNNPRSENIMFLGWYRLNETTGEKEFVSRDNVYTFTITETNKGAYFARFASGYYFWRIKNNKYSNYLTAVAKYTGSVSASAVQTALQTQLSFDNDLATALTDEGSIMKVWVSSHQPNTGKEVWDIYVQDEHTNQYYDATAISQGIFLQFAHNTDNTYFIQGNNNSFWMSETDDKKVNIVTNTPKSAYWRLEGMDKDLTTKENYFAVAPSEFIGPDNEGNYWTTLRVCFNMKYETSEITPYIVTAADANTGELELTEVTGGIIPEKKCVLLKCKSKDVTRNVMIPTTSTSSFDTSANMLTSSEYYYKNQSVNSSLNLKGIKLIDGRLGFGGDTKTTVDGNRAYLPITGNVALPAKIPNITLAALIASGDTQNTYNITDLRAVEFVDNDQVLICKDDNGYANKDACDNNYIDFMHTASLTNGLTSTIPANYDQSNWIGLRLPDSAIASANLLSYPLKGVVGKLTNAINPEFTLKQVPESNGEKNVFTPNVYIAASFNGTNHQIGKNGKEYFFVQPKPLEIANIEWAQWNGEKFVAPVADENNPTWNSNELQGEFEFNDSYLEQSGVILETGHTYEMLSAIVKYKDVRAEGNQYVVYPMAINRVTYVENGVITYIDNVANGKIATKVIYYNMMGMANDVPYHGINIVVTDYSDGSRSTTKVVR